jgi:hypothetical protein
LRNAAIVQHIDARSAWFIGDRALIPHLRCLLFGHRRSRSRARLVGGEWRSRCRRCGAKLVRLRPSKWKALDEPGYGVSSSGTP